jgi:hypothetical protein
MTCIAFTYLQHLRLKAIRGRGKKAALTTGRWTAAAAKPARHAARRHRPAARASGRPGPMSRLRAPVHANA